MHIAIPIMDLDTNRNTIATSLNVNGCIYLYDSDHREGNWMKTMDLAPNMGELLPALEKKTVSAIITETIHPMALKVLVNQGFDVYRAQGKVLSDNIQLFIDKALVKFNMDAAMDFATACNGACTSCETECDDDKKKEDLL